MTKLQVVREEINRLSQDEPHKYCDHWCSKCSNEKKLKCPLYLEEYHSNQNKKQKELLGTERYLETQYQYLKAEMDRFFDEMSEEIDTLAYPRESQSGGLLQNVEKEQLLNTVQQYFRKSRIFLAHFYFSSDETLKDLEPHFETISWYHSFLPSKIKKLVTNYYYWKDKDDDSEKFIELVSILNICQKGVRRSIEAVRHLRTSFLCRGSIVPTEILALLHNMDERLTTLECKIDSSV